MTCSCGGSACVLTGCTCGGSNPNGECDDQQQGNWVPQTRVVRFPPDRRFTITVMWEEWVVGQNRPEKYRKLKLVWAAPQLPEPHGFLVGFGGIGFGTTWIDETLWVPPGTPLPNGVTMVAKAGPNQPTSEPLEVSWDASIESTSINLNFSEYISYPNPDWDPNDPNSLPWRGGWMVLQLWR